MRRVLAVGEMLIDFTAVQTNTSVMQADAFTRNPGGAPANVAVAVARLGQAAAFAGCVGKDPFGAFLIQTLETLGVQTDHVHQVPGAHTSLAFVARHDGDPDYFFLRDPGADVLFGPNLAESLVLSSDTILHFGSNSLAEQPISEAVQQLVARAHTEGAIVSFDVNLRPAFWRKPDDTLRQCRMMAQEADLLKVNRDELLWLSGCGDVETGLRALGEWTDAVILCTLGSEGAVLALPKRSTGRDHPFDRVPAYPTTCVDATGAGDACIGALLAQLLECGVTRSELAVLQPEQWVAMSSFACAAAAVNVTRTGAMYAMPVRAEVEQVLGTSR